MTFEEALKAMRDGKTVRIQLESGISNRYKLKDGHFVFMTEQCGKNAIYCQLVNFHQDLILATDWEICDE